MSRKYPSRTNHGERINFFSNLNAIMLVDMPLEASFAHTFK